MVDEYQTGFILGRNIVYGIAVTGEVIHQIKKKRDQGYVLNLDFEKAYDSVNWECLMDVLEMRGFGPRWKGWIRSWLCFAKTTIMVNNDPGKESL